MKNLLSVFMACAFVLTISAANAKNDKHQTTALRSRLYLPNRGLAFFDMGCQQAGDVACGRVLRRPKRAGNHGRLTSNGKQTCLHG